MKKIFLSVLVTIGLFCTQQVMAQSNNDERVKEMTAKQTEQLSLTPEQVPKVETINADFAKKLEAVKSDGGSKMSKFKTLKNLDKERTNSMKAILTDEQFKKFEQSKKENQKELKTRYKGSK